MHAPSAPFCQEDSTIHRRLSKDQHSESAGRVSCGYDRQVGEPAAELSQTRNPLSNGFLSRHLGPVEGTPSPSWVCLCFISVALIKHPDKKATWGRNSSSVYSPRLQSLIWEKSQWQGYKTAYHLHRVYEQRESSAHLLVLSPVSCSYTVQDTLSREWCYLPWTESSHMD